MVFSQEHREYQKWWWDGEKPRQSYFRLLVQWPSDVPPFLSPSLSSRSCAFVESIPLYSKYSTFTFSFKSFKVCLGKYIWFYFEMIPYSVAFILVEHFWIEWNGFANGSYLEKWAKNSGLGKTKEITPLGRPSNTTGMVGSSAKQVPADFKDLGSHGGWEDQGAAGQTFLKQWNEARIWEF